MQTINEKENYEINNFTSPYNTPLESDVSPSHSCHCPAGPTGPIGATGPVGASGPVGATGPVGAVGPIGDTGPVGDVGPIGATGPAGVAGPIGATGPAGVAGPMGATGPAGIAGPMGATGPAGIAGPMGATGPAGVSGPVGTTGPMGATGPVGAVGPIGATGPAGVAGPMGATGPTGARGATGPVGPVFPAAYGGMIGDYVNPVAVSIVGGSRTALPLNFTFPVNANIIVAANGIRIVEPGDYMIGYSVSALPVSQAQTIQMGYDVNGVAFPHSYRSQSLSTTVQTNVSDFLILRLAAGDLVELKVFSGTSFALLLPSAKSVSFSAVKLSQ